MLLKVLIIKIMTSTISLTHLVVIHSCLFALDIQRGFYIPLECYCCVIGGNVTPN